jgi:hypothetical protein
MGLQKGKITIVLKGIKRVKTKSEACADQERYRIFDELLTKGQSSDLSEVALLCIRAGSIIISSELLFSLFCNGTLLPGKVI